MEKKTRFRDLKNGEMFEFSSRNEWYGLGLASGPWIKTGERTYCLNGEEMNRIKAVYRVGSIDVGVNRIND